MKINIFMLFIALVLAALVFIGFNYYHGDLLYSLGTAIAGFIMLATGMALTPADAPRSGIIMKVLSWVFFVILLVTDIVFAHFDVSETMFLIVNISMLCLWAVCTYWIARARQ